jgi:hypothetical protein
VTKPPLIAHHVGRPTGGSESLRLSARVLGDQDLKTIASSVSFQPPLTHLKR